MPLGYERINVKKNVPNKNIVFIKPLPGSIEKISKDFLERVAAQCLPIMNKHRLAVASLEEYPPNREFWGRCFNSGEVIQLVLRSPSSGRWLPFKFVQMVMMHELAHIHQMNHSKDFWALRNQYTAELRELWEQNYTGEGMWGEGILLDTGAFARENLELELGEEFPGHMCGGTFKSRGRKRKAKPKISYKEQKERRIRKKFGVNGIALGADDEKKVLLEKGRRPVGAPRVAGSTRGRELRAAAALARFGVKQEPELQTKDEDLVTDSETESDIEDGDSAIKSEAGDAVDLNGMPLLDSKGWGMVQVCEEEDKHDDMVKIELAELQDIGHKNSKIVTPRNIGQQIPPPQQAQHPKIPQCTLDSAETAQNPATLPKKVLGGPTLSSDVVEDTTTACPVCSVETPPMALTCAVCLHVLQPEFMPDSWRCKSSICKESIYRNVGDAGLCGVCGTKKSSNDGT